VGGHVRSGTDKGAMGMKKYRIHLLWEVEANNKQDARDCLDAGCAKFVSITTEEMLASDWHAFSCPSCKFGWVALAYNASCPKCDHRAARRFEPDNLPKIPLKPITQ